MADTTTPPHEILDMLSQDLSELKAEPWSSDATAWRLRAVEAFRHLVGERDDLTAQMAGLNFSPYVRRSGVQFAPAGWEATFDRIRAKAEALIDALRFRLALDGSPPKATDAADRLNSLHPSITNVASRLYQDSHFPSAIFEAFKAVEVRVRKLSGLKLKGRDLMAQAFSEERPVLRLNSLETDSDRDEQEGFRFIFMGAAQGIRNPKAHDIVEQEDAERTLDYLSLASLLMRRLDDVERV